MLATSQYAYYATLFFYFLSLGKLKIAPCTLGVRKTLCASVIYEPRTSEC